MNMYHAADGVARGPANAARYYDPGPVIWQQIDRPTVTVQPHMSQQRQLQCCAPQLVARNLPQVLNTLPPAEAQCAVALSLLAGDPLRQQLTYCMQNHDPCRLLHAALHCQRHWQCWCWAVGSISLIGSPNTVPNATALCCGAV